MLYTVECYITYNVNPLLLLHYIVLFIEEGQGKTNIIFSINVFVSLEIT